MDREMSPPGTIMTSADFLLSAGRRAAKLKQSQLIMAKEASGTWVDSITWAKTRRRRCWSRDLGPQRNETFPCLLRERSIIEFNVRFHDCSRSLLGTETDLALVRPRGDHLAGSGGHTTLSSAELLDELRPPLADIIRDAVNVERLQSSLAEIWIDS